MNPSDQRDLSPRLQPLLDHDYIPPTTHSSTASTISVSAGQYPPPKLPLQSLSRESTIRSHARSIAVPLVVRLPALIIAVISIGLASALLIWLIIKQYHGEGGGIVRADGRLWALTVLEPAGGEKGQSNVEETVFVGLIISSITTQFVSLSVSFLLGVVAYRLAIDWMEASKSVQSGVSLPTPFQYGLLLNMYSGGSFSSLWQSATYLTQKGRRPRAPKIFTRGFSCLATLFLLARLVGLSDVVLHATTTATSLPSVNTIKASDTIYGSSVNTSILQNKPSDDGINTHDIISAGLATTQNRSSVHRVFTLADSNKDGQMAYFARPIESIPPTISFLTSSIGLTSQCLPITSQCLPPSLLEVNTTHFPLDAKFDCTPAGYPEYRHLGTKTNNVTIADAFSVPYSQLSSTNSSGIVMDLNRNPFTAVYQRVVPGGDYPFQSSMVKIQNRGTGVVNFIILACKVSVYDITLRYASGSYSLVNASLLDPSAAAFATRPFIRNYENSPTTYYTTGYQSAIDTGYPIVTRLSSDIQTATSTNSDDFAQEMSAEVARLTLAYSAGLVTTTPAMSAASFGVVSRYALIPLAVDLLCVWTYAILAMLIFIWVSTARITHDVGFESWGSPHQETKLLHSRASTAELAYNSQLRVSQPLSVVSALFRSDAPAEGDIRGQRPDGWVQNNVADLFPHERRRSPLRLGLSFKGSEMDGTTAFGVWREDT